MEFDLRNEEVLQRAFNHSEYCQFLKHLDFLQYEQECYQILNLISKENIEYILVSYDQVINNEIDLEQFPNLTYVHILYIPLSHDDQSQFIEYTKTLDTDMYQNITKNFYHKFLNFCNACYGPDFSNFCNENLAKGSVRNKVTEIENNLIEYISNYPNKNTTFYVENCIDSIFHESSFPMHCEKMNLNLNVDKILHFDHDQYIALYPSHKACWSEDHSIVTHENCDIFKYSAYEHVNTLKIYKKLTILDFPKLHEYVLKFPNLKTIMFDKYIECEIEDLIEEFENDEEKLFELQQMQTFDMPFHIIIKSFDIFKALNYFSNVRSITLKRLPSNKLCEIPNTEIPIILKPCLYYDDIVSHAKYNMYKILNLYKFIQYENVTVQHDIFKFKYLMQVELKLLINKLH